MYNYSLIGKKIRVLLNNNTEKDWGGRGRTFKSCHSDQKSRINLVFILLFCFVVSLERAADTTPTALARWGGRVSEAKRLRWSVFAKRGAQRAVWRKGAGRPNRKTPRRRRAAQWITFLPFGLYLVFTYGEHFMSINIYKVPHFCFWVKYTVWSA